MASGEIVIEQAVAVLEQWVRRLLMAKDVQTLHDFYAQRRAVYQDFGERYFRGSYEEAAAAWWQDRIERD